MLEFREIVEILRRGEIPEGFIVDWRETKLGDQDFRIGWIKEDDSTCHNS